jgi:DNA-binding transcriptional regulator YbjK
MKLLTIIALIFTVTVAWTAEGQARGQARGHQFRHQQERTRVEVPEEIKALRKKHAEEMEALIQKYPEFAAEREKIREQLRHRLQQRQQQMFSNLCEECKKKAMTAHQRRDEGEGKEEWSRCRRK